MITSVNSAKRTLINALILSFPFAFAFANCIGVDLMDDVIVPEKVEVSAEATSLLVTESLQLSALYYNEFGDLEDASFVWTSNDPDVLTVNADGLVTAISPGEAGISASVNDIMSMDFLISADGVILTASTQTLEPGQTLQLSALDVNGLDPFIGKTPVWLSEDATVAMVNSTGLVTAGDFGETRITASADGISTAPFQITVADPARTATLMGSGSYNAAGIATLALNGSENLILTLSDDFEASVALGTFIYLSNSTDGNSTKSNGLDLGEISGNGAQSFNVTALDATTTLEQYQYVIVLCKPAGITFGFGDFDL